MFEIMRALLALNNACRAHGYMLHWELADEPGVGEMLRAEVALVEEDAQFVRDMQTMFAPVENP